VLLLRLREKWTDSALLQTVTEPRAVEKEKKELEQTIIKLPG